MNGNEGDIIFELWDDDTLRRDDFIGVSKVSLQQVVNLGTVSQWFKLEKDTKKIDKKPSLLGKIFNREIGEVMITFKWAPNISNQ